MTPPRCTGHRRSDGQPCRATARRGSDRCSQHPHDPTASGQLDEALRADDARARLRAAAAEQARQERETTAQERVDRLVAAQQRGRR